MLRRIVGVALAMCACGPQPGVFRLHDGFTNAYAVVGPEGIAVVDALEPDREYWIRDELELLGIALEDVDVLVLTHGHGDHAGSAAALRELTGAPIVIGTGDLDMVRRGQVDELHPTGVLGRSRLRRGLVHRSFPGFEPDVVVDDELDLHPYGVPARMQVMADGHTTGSAVVRLDSGDVICGDLVRSSFVLPRTPAEHLFHDDRDLVHQQLAMLVDDGAGWFWPGHGAPLSAPRIERWLRRF
ncbi:MAG: MBL fold metallo-hydrolase [Deltaproteobacteria bacterium]|nr:MBL fold metallo-hydrolase [Nannocystaceae bacterium]